MRRIYFDWASGAPVHPRVARAVYTAMEDYGGNPSAPHAEGKKAYDALSDARKRIAETLAVKPEELVFTSGGTEANNLAIRGMFRALHLKGVPYEKMHAVTLKTEHASVLESFALLEELGVKVTYLAPSFDCLVSPDEIVEALTPETVLVSLAHVNSETGVILPVSDISRAVSRWKERGISEFKTVAPEFSYPALHVDAAQAPMYLEAGPHALRADVVSYDAQKVMGPKGVGILYRDFSVPIAPITGGGSQERGVRPGTENVPGIIGTAVAFELAKSGRAAREKKVAAVRDFLIDEVLKKVPKAKLIGHPRRRIANNALFAIPGTLGDYLSVIMDQKGVSVTPRSACTGSGVGYSNVVLALTEDMDAAKGTIRFSLGPDAEEGDADYAVRALISAVETASRKL